MGSISKNNLIEMANLLQDYARPIPAGELESVVLVGEASVISSTSSIASAPTLEGFAVFLKNNG